MAPAGSSSELPLTGVVALSLMCRRDEFLRASGLTGGGHSARGASNGPVRTVAAIQPPTVEVSSLPRQPPDMLRGEAQFGGQNSCPMSKSMRVFCLLSVLGLIAGAVWLYAHGMKDEAFFAALFVYPIGGMALIGKLWSRAGNMRLPRRQYKGESRSELVKQELEDLYRMQPATHWRGRYGMTVVAATGGLLVWMVVLAWVFSLL